MIRIGDTRVVMVPGPWTRPPCAGSGPIWPVAGSKAGRKALPAFNVALGTPKLGLLKTLKSSARNWNHIFSRIGKFLNKEKSRPLKAGPSRMAFPELP